MQVLVLARDHAVLMIDARIPAVAGAGARPLLAVEAWAATLGLQLPAPAGSRPCADGRDFLFIVDRAATPTGLTWRPLREVVATDDATWRLYVALVLGGWAPPTRALDVWSFGNEPEMAARLAHLVVCGAKRVTMGWIDAALRDGTPLAVLGGVSVVTDGYGYPRAVLRTVAVDERAFAEVPAEAAAGEGEGDLSYDDWRDGHTAYFQGEAAKLGLVFDDRARIAVERFELLHAIGGAR